VGETQKPPFQLSFNSSLRVEFQGAPVTSDGGLILVRELDERLGLSALMERLLIDSRRGKHVQLPLSDLLRQSIYSRLAGYEDVNDAARLSQDPTFRLIGSPKIWERGAALTSRLQSFETEVLTQVDKLAGLAALNRELIVRAEAIASPRRVVLDMDSTEIRVYGEQEQSTYNGHFESTCYHPLLLFNREGDCLAAKLRPGNVRSIRERGNRSRGHEKDFTWDRHLPGGAARTACAGQDCSDTGSAIERTIPLRHRRGME